jgi:hypothetical protein
MKPERQIDCETYRVEINNTATDEVFTLWVYNASDNAYTIFDIGARVKDWLKEHEIDGWIIGIKENRRLGFCIVPG